MIFDLLLSQWRVVLILALSGLLAIQTHRLSNAEQEIVAVNTRFQSAIDAAKAKEKAAKELNERTNHEINENQPELLAKARLNAPDNYRRRFGVVERSVAGNLGSGIGNVAPNGVRVDSTDNAGTIQADNSKGASGESNRLHDSKTCIPDQRFLNDVSEAAVKLAGWEAWRLGNGLEYEK